MRAIIIPVPSPRGTADVASGTVGRTPVVSDDRRIGLITRNRRICAGTTVTRGKVPRMHYTGITRGPTASIR